jgi:hypothetical protein
MTGCHVTSLSAGEVALRGGQDLAGVRVELVPGVGWAIFRVWICAGAEIRRLDDKADRT